MHLKTILNRVEPIKPFVYEDVRTRRQAGQLVIEATIAARRNGCARCSGCGRRAAGYDRLPPRKFQFVPLWGIAVYFVYALRRVNCPACGVRVESVPWAEGKCQHTRTYQWFLARWARRLSWQGTARVFHTTWEHVRDAVRHAVFWGIVHRDVRGITAIGVDEIAWRKGHKYLTLVYQIDAGAKRLLWVARERTEASLEQFFDLVLGPAVRSLRFVCSDLWQPYLNVIARKAPRAVHILDRFHIMSLFNKAIDQIRAEEARRMKQEGYEPILKHSRWCLLKRPENRTHEQTVKIRELLQYNLQSVRAHLHREDFQRFWNYTSLGWAEKFLHEWGHRALRSRLEPLKKVARTLRRNQTLLINWFRAGGTISAGAVEGLNNKAKLTIRKAYGFRNFETAELALYHQLGNLPEPNFTHEFC